MKKGKHVLFGIAAVTTADKFKLDNPGSRCHAMKVQQKQTKQRTFVLWCWQFC